MLSRIFTNFNEHLLSILFTAPVILQAIICHEYAHAWVSYKLVDPIEKCHQTYANELIEKYIIPVLKLKFLI